MWIYREIFCYVWFFKGAWNPYVNWRGFMYKLKWGGTGVRVETNEEIYEDKKVNPGNI